MWGQICDLNFEIQKAISVQNRSQAVRFPVQLFSERGLALNKRMGLKTKRIALLMDNASSHKIPGVEPAEFHGLLTLKLEWVFIIFLPANTTSVIQPSGPRSHPVLQGMPNSCS
jgi:hypothetical protein